MSQNSNIQWTDATWKKLVERKLFSLAFDARRQDCGAEIMNLYKISQDVNADYDTYDSAVVAAESEKEARLTDLGYSGKDSPGSWASPYDVKVELLGTARDGLKAGIIVASFHAG